MRAPIRGDAGRRTESSGREERGLIVALPSLTLRVPNPKRNPDREGGGKKHQRLTRDSNRARKLELT